MGVGRLGSVLAFLLSQWLTIHLKKPGKINLSGANDWDSQNS